MTSNQADPENKSLSPYLFWALLFIVVLCLVLASYQTIIKGGPFIEKDFIWLEAGKIGAQYLAYFDYLKDLFQKPIMVAVRDSRPSEWIFHVFLSKLVGNGAAVHMWAVLLIFTFNSILLGVLANSLYKKRSIAVAATLLFALHPQLSGGSAIITAAAAQLAIFWLFISFISLLRYKKHGHIYQLAPMICGVFLSYSAHDLGLIALPTLLILDLVTMPNQWRIKTFDALLGVFGRMLLALIPLVSFLFIWIPASGGRDVARTILALGKLKFIFFAAKQGLERIFFPLPPQVGYREIFGGLELGEILVFGLPILMGIALALVYQEKRRLFPFSLIFFSIIFQVHNLVTQSPDSPLYCLSLITGVAGMALLLGEILMKIPPKAAAYLAVFAILCLYGASGHFSARHWNGMGAQVNMMSSQLESICSDLPDTSDVFIVGAGRYTERMLAAHLDYKRRFKSDKRLRFSFIQNGMIFPAYKGGPIGQNPSGITRLQFDEFMTFIGYGIADDITDLTTLINKKISIADKVMNKERHMPPRWVLGPEVMIDQWTTGQGETGLMPIEDSADFMWFVEGLILHLHPYAGRNLY